MSLNRNWRIAAANIRRGAGQRWLSTRRGWRWRCEHPAAPGSGPLTLSRSWWSLLMIARRSGWRWHPVPLRLGPPDRLTANRRRGTGRRRAGRSADSPDTRSGDGHLPDRRLLRRQIGHQLAAFHQHLAKAVRCSRLVTIKNEQARRSCRRYRSPKSRPMPRLSASGEGLEVMCPVSEGIGAKEELKIGSLAGDLLQTIEATPAPD